MANTAMEFYRGFVRGMLERDKPETVFNDSPEYARVLIAELLHHAERKASIYCKCLGRDVWGDDEVMSALRGAIGRGVSIEAVLQQEPDEGNPAANLLDAYGMPVSVAADSGVSENFLIIDDSAYRVETDVEARKGYASKRDVKTLCQVFENIRAHATPMKRGR